ncbi:MAG TPA: ATP-binding protein [Spirochaetia bacterium]|nr:ATP-binding protein [Spirochaetia bacterium]
MSGAGTRTSEGSRWALRVQLTGWYLILTAVIVAAFAIYLLSLTRANLVRQVDQALVVAESQVRAALDTENGRPVFQPVSRPGDAAYQFAIQGFAARVVSSTGAVQTGIGTFAAIPGSETPREGFSTRIAKGGVRWRILSRPLSQDGSEGSFGDGLWLEVARSLFFVDGTMARLRSVLLVSLPALLVLIALGGLFLSDRALRPVRQVVSAMRGIEPRDLSTRLALRRSSDEISSLAAEFNGMLDRIEGGFRREQQFSEDVAHELRTPLTVLQGQLDVGLSRRRSGAEYERTLETLRGEVDRLIRLTNDLLLLARLDRGSVPIRVEPIDLDLLLSGLVEQIAPIAETKGVRIRTDLPHPFRIDSDTDQLVRLFLNLLDNAIKYNIENGELSVRAFDSGGTLTVAIRNDGPAIPPALLPRLFDRFYRLETDRSRQSGGTGLGLTIADDIARQLGGRLTLESGAHGTTAAVTLPAQPDGRND